MPPVVACDGDDTALDREGGGSAIVPHQSVRLFWFLIMILKVGLECWLGASLSICAREIFPLHGISRGIYIPTERVIDHIPSLVLFSRSH